MHTMISIFFPTCIICNIGYILLSSSRWYSNAASETFYIVPRSFSRRTQIVSPRELSQGTYNLPHGACNIMANKHRKIEHIFNAFGWSTTRTAKEGGISRQHPRLLDAQRNDFTSLAQLAAWLFLQCWIEHNWSKYSQSTHAFG